MRTDLYWVEGPWPGRLAVMARPRAGDWLQDAVGAWRRDGVDAVLSLLTLDETKDLDLLREAELCQKVGMEFLAFPIPDRGVPSSTKAARSLLTDLDRLLMDGKTLAIHCRQGIGRAPLIAAGLLTMTGLEPEEAFRRLSIARGCAVPETVEQRAWVETLAWEAPATQLS